MRYSYRMQEKDSLNWAMASVIYEARKAAGLTQVELADFSGLSKPYVSGLERGNINASGLCPCAGGGSAESFASRAYGAGGTRNSKRTCQAPKRDWKAQRMNCFRLNRFV